MALFVDGPASDAGDLARLDGGLLETAAALSIDVTTRLQIAHETLAADLQIWLDRIGGITMEQVVVNDALRTWESTQALAMVYREAYFSDLAERYHVRWDEYSRLTRQAYERFVAGGLPTVSDPVLLHGIIKAGVIVDNWDRTLALLRARRVPIAFGPFPAGRGQRANLIIRDNSGNLIQFFGRE